MMKEVMVTFKEEKWLEPLLPEPSLKRRGKVAGTVIAETQRCGKMNLSSVGGRGGG